MNHTINAILSAAKDTHKFPILRIIETGCESTEDIVKWMATVKSNPPSNITFDTADLNGTKQSEIHNKLEKEGWPISYTLHTQDHMKFLSDITWADIVFLHPDDLQSGLEEFKLAASIGAKAVIIADYGRRAALAVSQAKRLGWVHEPAGVYSIIIRPEN